MRHEQIFGEARWIGGGTAAPCIRASFDVPRGPVGSITICGLGYFELYINGSRVSDDLFVPAYSDYAPRVIMKNGQPFPEVMRHRCYVLRYSLDGLLHAGRNELAVALGPGFFATPLNGFDAPMVYGDVRLCYRMDIRGENGEACTVYSGPDARWTQGVVTESDLTHGEKHDLRLQCEDWTMADASTWEKVHVLENLDTDFFCQDCPADRIIRWIEPKVVNRFPGCTVWDAGENITGWVVLEDESEAGEEIHVRFSENLSCCGALDELYMHWQYFDVVSDGRGRLLHPRFTWHAFRYFSVSGKARVKGVAVIHSDVPVSSAFRCTHPTLNWLYDAYVRTQLSNLHGGIPSDCPHLERRGYTGDGQLTAETALLALNPTALMRKWMRDILDCQDEITGHVQNTAPYTRSGGGPGGWGCAMTEVPWAYYQHTGDSEVLREMHAGMARYLDYLRLRSEGGLVMYDTPGEWCLGDWCCPGGVRLPEPFVNTYFLIRSLDTMMKVERALQLPENPQWITRRREAVQALEDAYYDAATGDYAAGVQGANAFALDLGLGDERTLRRLAAHYEALGGYDTGIFGTEIVTRVLIDRGYASLACRLLTSENPASYNGWMKAGATTLWEYWPGDIQRSMSHPMFGAPVKALFHAVLGMRAQAPGWHRVDIAPLLTKEIPSADGFITTPQGKLCVAYDTREAAICFRITLPHGTEASLHWQGQVYPLHTGENHLTFPI